MNTKNTLLKTLVMSLAFIHAGNIFSMHNELTVAETPDRIPQEYPELFSTAERLFNQGSNYPKAFEYFNEIANKSPNFSLQANANYFLGFMHSRGTGVAQDTYKAQKYFTKACQQNDAPGTKLAAQYELGFMYVEETYAHYNNFVMGHAADRPVCGPNSPVAINYQKAEEFLLPLTKGTADQMLQAKAQLLLGEFYLNLNQKEKAFELLKKAAQQRVWPEGQRTAQEKLNEISGSLFCRPMVYEKSPY